ncbi:helix-turn-helix domain-containing protein (plasmid) [Lichenicola cladoniae]|uniref:Helix-turn-helix domain-containing protein n=1 Tax=Lichenicola cladoniae TaxID=1484109 RepID=A0A6M8HXZ2_9PROT|nr:helix-turn-helix domain-containing protein [Lichenicola cladoniae]NPD66351.1 helix-turn-helix domain-containing protein [Acetobacteraceae bacterium]QKE93116.1 helix-turn-helix domain-containing protein [Lichenicola cladoniae]
MPLSDREPKAGKTESPLATSMAKNKDSGKTTSNGDVEPDPLLLYMARAVLKRRKEMGLTQLELSRKAGCNSTAIFMVEAAKHNMTIKSVMLLADAMDLQVSDFFPRSTPRNAAKMAEVSEVLTDMAGRFAIQVRSLERLASELRDDAKQ